MSFHNVKTGSNQFNPYSPIKKEDTEDKKVAKVSKKVNKMKLNAPPVKSRPYGISTDPSDPDQFLVPDPATQAWIQERQLERLKNTTDTGVLYLDQQANPPFARVDDGALWVQSGTPNSLHFQDNHGTDRIVDTTSTNPFDGWWKVTTACGSMFNFGNAAFNSYPLSVFSATIPMSDQYIQIDTTTSPYVTINTTYGTLKYPRYNQLNTNIDPPPIENNFYYMPDANTLIHINDLNGPDPSVFADGAPYSAWSLKLVNDTTIAASPNSQPFYVGYTDQLTLYKKIPGPPAIMPADDTSLVTFPDYNDPVDLARYIFSQWQTSLNQSQNVNLGNTGYVGFKQANVIFNQFITGLPSLFTKTTPIRQIRVSVAYQTVKLTDIYTGDPIANTGIFAYTTPGATVTLAGFVGPLAVLNGTYVNGVSSYENAGVPNANGTFADVGSGGTWNDVFTRFLLNYNSSALSGLATPSTGFISVPAGATVTVTHQFTSIMEYPAFIAAVTALFYALYNASGTHQSMLFYLDSANALFPYSTWAAAKAAVAAGTELFGYVYPRVWTFDPSLLYFNSSFTFSTASFGDYNDPHNIMAYVTANPYNVIAGNYLINPQALWFAIQGTLDPDQPDPAATFGYAPLLPGTGRAHFVGALTPATLVSGVLTANSPDNTHWNPWGAYPVPTLQNGTFIGQINPAFTGGKVIGYLYIYGYAGDVNYLMSSGLYSPDSPSNPTVRSGREAYNSVLSVIMTYFNSIGCTRIIYDQRGNVGGDDNIPHALSEFMGTKRHAKYFYQTKPDDGYSALIDPATYPSANNYIQGNEAVSQYCYTDISTSKYPSAMWQGTSLVPKKLVFLDNVFAGSSGDLAPYYFLGENIDGNLGNFVTGQVIGNIDGRCRGSQPGAIPIPCSPVDPYFTSHHGHGVPSIYVQGDFPNVQWKWGVTNYTPWNQAPGSAPIAAPTLVGGAGGNPLPMSGETTVYYDFGFVTPHPDAHLPGWTKGLPVGQPSVGDQTTWRDRILEQAIRSGSL